MKILTGQQIKEADKYTIENEPISSIDLMERASNTIAQWFCENVDKNKSLLFLIGKGNNGGDGLAIARILFHAGYDCSVCMLTENKEELSEDCRYNLERLPKYVKFVRFVNFLDNLPDNTIIVDALLGSGVNGALKEPFPSLIEQVNTLPNKVISIDLPSGMITEFGNSEQKIIKADITLTLEFPKLAMLLPEAGECCGNIIVLAIGLSQEYVNNSDSQYYYITESLIEELRLKRNKFGHKGMYGHALLIGGSRGMAGAAILAAGAALRSGCGLVTVHLPQLERFSLQAIYPSAMTSLDNDDCFSELPENLSTYTAIGIGCGMGKAQRTVKAYEQLLKSVGKPMVIDADALNIIADHYKLRQYIPAGSILTPHPGELERLTGEWKSEEEKLQFVKKLAANLQSVIIVKGAHTMICLPNGDCYFNSTGNSGMAKGGSGDVLTGYLTGLLARGYSSEQAAVLGVYSHGRAGDKAASEYGEEAMNSKDLIDELAFNI